MTLAVLGVLLALILAVVLTSPLFRPPSGEETVDIAFTDLDGTPFRTSDFAGKVLVVDLMAANCPPCTAEMPYLLEFWAAHGGGDVEFLSLSIWVESGLAGETVEDLAAFKARWEAPWRFGVPEDARDLVVRYQIASPPFKLVLDRAGRLVATLSGTTTAAELAEAIEGL